MTHTRNDIENYFKKIHCRFLSIKNLGLTEQLDYLQEIFTGHIQAFPYHNFELRVASQSHPLYRKNLTLFKMKPFLKGKNGGFCFQSAQILYDALNATGFDVYLSVAKMLNGLKPNSSETKQLPATHVILLVTINKKRYLLDPSMAMNGHCMPFLLTDLPTIYTQSNQRFKIETIEDNFLLYREVKGKWLSLFYSLLFPADINLISTQLIKLQCFPDTLGIRDTITLVGIGTPTGGKSLLWSSISNSFVFKTICSTAPDKEERIGMLKAFNLICSEFKIEHLKEAEFNEYCNKKLWPTLKTSVDISFPIDEHEKNEIKQKFNRLS